jgi:hypothetical protein
VIDEFMEEPTAHKSAGAVMSLLSRTGPEVPPDVADAPIGTQPVRHFADEPTQTLPVVVAAVPPASPPRTRPAPGVAARAVIVYEPQPRRPWRLRVFTAVLVALTIGVALGQTAAYQPASRSGSSAQAGVVPSYAAPSSVAPSPSGQASPGAGQQVTAPLGSARTRLLEVAGAATVLHIRSANLGDVLFSIATVDPSAAPRLVDTERGPRLELVRTGIAGTVGAEIRLNAKVSWTIRLTGRSTEQDIDMRLGGLARVELAGGASRAVLQLPKPKGTVPLSVSGAMSQLSVRAETGIPVRLRLGTGADLATVDGTTYRRVKPGTALTSTGWKSAENRYDVATSATVGAVLVDHRSSAQQPGDVVPNSRTSPVRAG